MINQTSIPENPRLLTESESSGTHLSSAPVPSPNAEVLTREVAHVMFDRYRAVSGDRVSDEERVRMIVVVGAGASHAACGLPLGKDLASMVERRVRKKGFPRRLIDAELDRLEFVNRLRRDDFETRLLALSKFDAGTVLNALRDECDFAHYPSFTYEILAHLMKHGFLDAIVNFNFDELLDQAIDEEVGAERYARIVRDGDWSRNLRTDKDDPFRFDRPLYIKPHGTVSEPESLRFTRDAYFALPTDTAHLLRVLLEGSRVRDFLDRDRVSDAFGITVRSKATQTRRVCLLVIGHALESFEFNKLLEKSPRSSRLYVVTHGKRARPDPRREWHRSLKAMASGRSIRISEATGALDNLLRFLWEAIAQAASAEANNSKPWMGVRGIIRHELIADLFRPHRYGKLLRRETSGLSSKERTARKAHT